MLVTTNTTTMICIMVLIVAVCYGMYDIFRKKYEVLGLFVDPQRGGMCKSQKFRTRREAEKCYAEHRHEFSTICIIER